MFCEEQASEPVEETCEDGCHGGMAVEEDVAMDTYHLVDEVMRGRGHGSATRCHVKVTVAPRISRHFSLTFSEPTRLQGGVD
jgi:hypothetical protein